MAKEERQESVGRDEWNWRTFGGAWAQWRKKKEDMLRYHASDFLDPPTQALLEFYTGILNTWATVDQ